MGARLDYLNIKTRLVTEVCCNCHVLFAITEELYNDRLSDKAWFYCPNGHAQQYAGKSDAQKAKDAEARATRLNAALDQADAAREATERQLSAQKGVTTKLKRRALNGVCPCCKRTFANVANHMKNKHPDQVEESNA